MKIILKSGETLCVDDSKLDYENSYIPCIDRVTMMSDGVCLEDIWIATCQKDLRRRGVRDGNRLEFVAEEIFEHEPTREELIYFMAKSGCSMDDVVDVTQAYRLNVEYD